MLWDQAFPAHVAERLRRYEMYVRGLMFKDCTGSLWPLPLCHDDYDY